MDLESVIQSKVRKRKKKIMYYCICVESRKQYKWTYLQGRSRDWDTGNRCVNMAGVGWTGILGLMVCALPRVTQTASGVYGRVQGVSDPEGWSGGGRELKAEGMYVYTQLTHFIVQQKPIQRCKVTTPQLKKITSSLIFPWFWKLTSGRGGKKTWPLCMLSP